MLNESAKNAGVKNFDQFHNAGYKGLYGGETADDIFKRKGLRYREDILDNMERYNFSNNCSNLFDYITDIETLNEYLSNNINKQMV